MDIQSPEHLFLLSPEQGMGTEKELDSFTEQETLVNLAIVGNLLAGSGIILRYLLTFHNWFGFLFLRKKPPSELQRLPVAKAV